MAGEIEKTKPNVELPVVIIIMGVSGSGKTVIGNLLAQRLAFQFADADDFHSAANIEKMRTGHPLTDADRVPWLDSLSTSISKWIEKDEPTVLACSALKQSYRNILQQGQTISNKIRFVYLKGSFEMLSARLAARKGHYMKADLLKSQLATLEEPQDALTVDASLPEDKLVELIVSAVQ